MSSLKYSATLLMKRVIRIFSKRQVRTYFLHKNVPYYAQWESSNLVTAILDKTIDARNDPKWKESGAESKDEYVAWSWNGCGMACTKMLLASQAKGVIPLATLGKKCIEYGGYVSLEPGAVGLHYAPYVQFLREEYGLSAKVRTTLLIQEIIEALSEEKFVITSVSPKIRQPSSRPKKKGGHLILMLGYDLEKQLFIFHNPSGTDAHTQSYAAVSIQDFKKFFGGRGIVIEKQEYTETNV